MVPHRLCLIFVIIKRSSQTLPYNQHRSVRNQSRNESLRRLLVKVLELPASIMMMKTMAIIVKRLMKSPPRMV
ncbi:hypothetical protein QR98_0103910 [Sarcoptes scabiei]|uniref:Uncharacterized protein n=1 Tax=Sarcoptes scabiei TaxID=52283 RepID=A0A132AME1_SARSC|nr:hypothetical protein QR98_0103910 [Sarcoptes scabiei]